MPQPRRVLCTVTAWLAAASLSLPASAGPQGAPVPETGRQEAERKPSLSLRATPNVGFAPLRVTLTAELRGGADDHAELYCSAVEWNWGDETISENSEDCAPYEAGKSQIRRRHSASHTFRIPGAYRVSIRLKQKDKVVATATANVQVRSGLSQGFE